MKSPSVVGYLPGIFDMFRIDHLDQLKAARSHCDYLIVGVVSDSLATSQGGPKPVFEFSDRLNIIRGMKGVDAAVGHMTSDLIDVWEQIRFHRLLIPGPFLIQHGSVYEELAALDVEVLALAPGRSSASLLNPRVDV